MSVADDGIVQTPYERRIDRSTPVSAPEQPFSRDAPVPEEGVHDKFPHWREGTDAVAHLTRMAGRSRRFDSSWVGQHGQRFGLWPLVPISRCPICPAQTHFGDRKDEEFCKGDDVVRRGCFWIGCEQRFRTA